MIATNLDYALDKFAELGVPKLIDGEDIAIEPDPKSLYAYLTQYDYFDLAFTVSLMLDRLHARFDPNAPKGPLLGGSRLSSTPGHSKYVSSSRSLLRCTCCSRR